MIFSYFPKHATDTLSYREHENSNISVRYEITFCPKTSNKGLLQRKEAWNLFYIYVHIHNRILLLDGSSQDFDVLSKKYPPKKVHLQNAEYNLSVLSQGITQVVNAFTDIRFCPT